MCPPDEDALILFRYAENLAEHGIVSYNPGGAPSEGATDFCGLLCWPDFTEQVFLFMLQH